MSQNSEGEKSFLSPVKVHSQRHGAGNLTGHPRKVKDLAADFHNYIMKWEALNAQGMDIVTKIANIKIEKVFDVQEDGSTTSALPNELNPLCESLSEVVESMSNLESKLSNKAKNAEALVALEKFQPGGDKSLVLFGTMTLKDVADTTREIHRDFHKELQLKRCLLRQVAHTSNREETEALAACWLHQPYIRPQCHDLLHALLKDTGHINTQQGDLRLPGPLPDQGAGGGPRNPRQKGPCRFPVGFAFYCATDAPE
ncbi:cyclin-dependent kinase 2-interacting protein-like [Plakobranchus ocellatus]|uniref:Cyclin-dependent kinase 2-interacting protein-like n=1 Tax=Plakobranchus ocellatus TaxID=259542 RepID=A0AAV4A2S8_9GAST|nr:cyclin-dependent kinase 2-interacting protein-like [Plakobranchus ocellatus]